MESNDTLEQALDKVRAIFDYNKEYFTDNLGNLCGEGMLVHPRIARALTVLTNVCIEQNKRIKALEDKLEKQNAG